MRWLPSIIVSLIETAYYVGNRGFQAIPTDANVDNGLDFSKIILRMGRLCSYYGHVGIC